MSTFATLHLQRKREDLGINIRDRSQPTTFDSSPNPLRLFTPRNIAIKENAAGANKTNNTAPKPEGTRHVHFVETNELDSYLEAKWQKLKKSLLVELEEEPDSRTYINHLNRSPHTTTSSSNDTPNSITDELTNVPEPKDVQQKLLERTNDFTLNGIKKTEDSETPKSTLKRTFENGYNKKTEDSETPKSTLKRTFENGYNKNNENDSNGISNKKYLKISSVTNSPNSQNKNGDDTGPSTSKSNPVPLANGNGQRKRLISERSEKESQYPRINRAVLFDTWDGCPYIPVVAQQARRCGIGLHNPMNNCFLNSVLQSIVHIPHLARMLVESTDWQICTRNPQCLHCGLKDHILKAIRANYAFQPNWINNHLRKIFPQHRSGVQEDAHEMLTLLLNALEPLPSKQTPNGLKISGGMPSTPIEQIFGGNLRNEVICNTCKHPHTNYERIRELNIGLNRMGPTKLDELITDFFKPEQLQNFSCARCKKQSATRYTHLLSSPSVLIIQLKRFNAYGGKNRTPVAPNLFLEFSKYSYKQEDIVYKLHGLIQHIGGGINFGHYICAMRGFDNKTWFLFDDSERKPIDGKYVTDKMEPYILFYTKIQTTRNQQPNQRRSFDGYVSHSMPKQPRFGLSANIQQFNGTRQKMMMNHTFSSFNR